jgi:hypothetical protein
MLSSLHIPYACKSAFLFTRGFTPRPVPKGQRADSVQLISQAMLLLSSAATLQGSLLCRAEMLPPRQGWVYNLVGRLEVGNLNVSLV